MIPIKCRSCGQLHWGRVCPGVVAEKIAAPVAETIAEHPAMTMAKKRTKVLGDPEHPLGTFKMVPVSAPKPPFDRVAYQREYMRKRRAAQKAKP